MDKGKLKWITWAFVGVMVLVIVLMLSGGLRRTSRITLPSPESAPGSVTEDPAVAGDALTVVAVTPETVQAAIATLDRPADYRRTVTVEQLWSGGSASYETTVSVSGGWTRTDRTLSDGQTRHAITNGETTYIWYNSDRSWFTGFAGGITADNEQTIPTYEDILALPVESITTADYRMVSQAHCIYVETAEDPEGYTLRYWVSVDTGLLVVAEKLLEGEPVYRMGSLELDPTPPTLADFTLPDGTVLLEG